MTWLWRRNCRYGSIVCDLERRRIVVVLPDFEMATQAARLAEVAEAIEYMLKRWDGCTSFLTDRLICLTNNAAERALRGIALGR